MKLLFLTCLLAGAHSLAATQNLPGFDVRAKANRYEIKVSPENAILEERRVDLYRISGPKKVHIQSFDVVYVHEDMEKDIDAVYSNENAVLQFGRMKKDPKTNKLGRVVVLRVMQKPNAKKMTLVFDAPASLQ